MVTKSKTGQVVLNIVFIILAVWAVAPFLLLISSSQRLQNMATASGRESSL